MGDCNLVHDGEGGPLHKDAVVKRIQSMAQATGHGNLVIRGHSMRVTGAMRMALAGLPVSVIKVFGRWASEAVMQYLRESVVQGQGALITRQIQDGLHDLPLVLKQGTAAAHAPNRRLPDKRKAPQYKEEENMPKKFKLAHPVQRYVLEKVREGERMHLRGKEDETVCGWKWVSAGSRPRGKFNIRHMVCTLCGAK